MMLNRPKLIAVVFLIFSSVIIDQIFAEGQSCHRDSQAQIIIKGCNYTFLEIQTATGLTITPNNCDKFQNALNFVVRPRVICPNAVKGQLYTLLIIEAGLPLKTNPYNAFLHGFFTNIPGEDLLVGNLNNADVVASYIPSIPIPPILKYTYRYIVFQQAQRVNFPSLELIFLRINFNLDTFLKLISSSDDLCGPICENQFSTNILTILKLLQRN